MTTDWKFELIAGPFNGATEGPVWDGKTVLFSVPVESRILSYEPPSGNVTEFRKYTNRDQRASVLPRSPALWLPEWLAAGCPIQL